jgi:hypothetical protein
LIDAWKLFDVFVVAGTALGYIFNNSRVVQFAKAFRLMRVVRLMAMIKPIRIILETLIMCIPQVRRKWGTDGGMVGMIGRFDLQSDEEMDGGAERDQIERWIYRWVGADT